MPFENNWNRRDLLRSFAVTPIVPEFVDQNSDRGNDLPTETNSNYIRFSELPHYEKRLFIHSLTERASVPTENSYQGENIEHTPSEKVPIKLLSHNTVRYKGEYYSLRIDRRFSRVNVISFEEIENVDSGENVSNIDALDLEMDEVREAIRDELVVQRGIDSDTRSIDYVSLNNKKYRVWFRSGDLPKYTLEAKKSE